MTNQAARHGRTLVISGVFVVLAACGSHARTNGAAIEELRPEYAPRRAALASLAAALPPVGTVTGDAPLALTPPFVWNEPADTFNADIMLFPLLLDVDHVITDEEGVDLLINDLLTHCLAWTGPNSPLRNLEEEDGDRILADCRGALARPYLLVLRQASFEAPRIVSDTEFTPGVLTTEAFVVRTSDWQVATSFQMISRTPPTVLVDIGSDGHPTPDAIHTIRIALWANAVASLRDAMTASGATFVRY
jgi:hypothetical protein